MGKVLTYDQSTWSTMRMVKEAEQWCHERNREGSAVEHRRVLTTLIKSGDMEAA